FVYDVEFIRRTRRYGIKRHTFYSAERRLYLIPKRCPGIPFYTAKNMHPVDRIAYTVGCVQLGHPGVFAGKLLERRFVDIARDTAKEVRVFRHQCEINFGRRENIRARRVAELSNKFSPQGDVVIRPLE